MNLTQGNLNKAGINLNLNTLLSLFEKYEISTLNRICGFFKLNVLMKVEISNLKKRI